jgi:CDP-diacylglycerol--glycerol-3-phosphate 3-phosphatidyltransferase
MKNFKSHLNVPNVLTIIRILLIPIFVLTFYLPWSWSHITAAIIFLVACATDWLDGYLARALKQTSLFGAFLDPIADKLAVSIALVLVVGENHFFYITLPAAIIVGREIIVSGLREWMAELGKRASLAVNNISKTKTAIQMISLVFLIAFNPETSWLGVLGYVLLYVAAILTLWTMMAYLKLAWPELSINNEKPLDTKK